MTKDADFLQQGIQQLKLSLSAQQQKNLLDYLALLMKWNGSYNLTAVRDPVEIIFKHLLDSLAIVSFLRDAVSAGQQQSSVLDVGSGAGLPGIPLAIVFPEWNFTLVDSNGKKAAFLQQVKTELKIANLVILNERVENIDETFDQIVSRAFSSLKRYLELIGTCQKPNSIIWAMKGKYPEDELREIPKNYNVNGSYSLQVPGVEGERHLLKISRKDL